MSNAMLWIAIGVGELLLFALALLLYAWIRNQAARQRDRTAVKTLVRRVTKGKPEREQAIRQFLIDNYQLQGKDLERETVRISRAELRLTQEVANLYKQRDVAQLVQFPLALANAVEPYWALMGTPVSSDIEDAGAENAELVRLREENASLADELQITMDTMSRMLTEYSAMFAGATPAEISGTAGVGVPGEEADTAEVPAAAADDAFELSESDLEVSPADSPSDDGPMLDEAGGQGVPDEVEPVSNQAAETDPAAGSGVDAALELGSDPGFDAEDATEADCEVAEAPLGEDGLFDVDVPSPDTDAAVDPPDGDPDEKVAV